MAHHVIDTSTPVGRLRQNAIDHIRAAQVDLQRVVDLEVAAAGSPADWTKIEGGAFGVATSEGSAVHALVNSLNGEIQAITAGFIDPIDQGA